MSRLFSFLSSNVDSRNFGSGVETIDHIDYRSRANCLALYKIGTNSLNEYGCMVDILPVIALRGTSSAVRRWRLRLHHTLGVEFRNGLLRITQFLQRFPGMLAEQRRGPAL